MLPSPYHVLNFLRPAAFCSSLVETLGLRFSSCLDTQLQPKMDCEKSPISVGPWGGQDGKTWNDGVYTTIRQIVIVHGAGVDSIQIEYDKNGTSVWSEKHGGNDGNNTDKVNLDYPDEFLTSIHGHYGSLNEWSQIFVRSLTFTSNRRTYGPFGIQYGTYFSLPTSGSKIVGFHGKCGWYLDAIGAYLKPLQISNPSKSLVYSQSYNISSTEKAGYSIVQGNIGNDFDIVLALRQKGSYQSGFSTPQAPQIQQTPKLAIKEVSSSSSSSSDSDTESAKGKAVAMPSKVDGHLTYGPWGGSGGTIFEDGGHTGIRQINLSRNIGLVAIRVLYDDNGVAKWGYKHGGTGGYKYDKVVFDYPYEILRNISGTYGPAMMMGPTIVKSLTFHTTKMKHGPFGEEQGTPFKIQMPEGKIVGFHGRRGLFVDAIGVHVKEGKVTPPSRPHLPHPTGMENQNKPSIAGGFDSPNWSNKLMLARHGQKPEVAMGVVKEPAPSGPGPWGGDGGRPWDDGVFSGIRQIYLLRSEAIQSIQIEYDRGGQSVWSVKHGGNGGETMHRIKLEYPHEVLICVSGYYGPITNDGRPKVIRSLTFHTSRGRYGPYGDEVGTFFTSTTTEGKVVGFHGRSSLYLDAIGVHMQHWLGNQRSIKPPLLYKMFN